MEREDSRCATGTLDTIQSDESYCPTAQTFCRPFSCSADTKPATFKVIQKMGPGSRHRCGVCCLRTPWGPPRLAASFSVVGGNR